MGPYSVITETSGLVFISGQVAVDPATGERVRDDVVAQTHQIMTNIGALLGDVGLGYSDVAKTTIFLSDIAHFSVVNEAYAQYFESDFPARSTVQVAALPGGFLVEIEVVASR